MPKNEVRVKKNIKHPNRVLFFYISYTIYYISFFYLKMIIYCCNKLIIFMINYHPVLCTIIIYYNNITMHN